MAEQDAIMGLIESGILTLDWDIDMLARRVREAWVDWARIQPDPKPSWLVPWDELGQADQDADRAIARVLLGEITNSVTTRIALYARGARVLPEPGEPGQ